MSIPKLIDLIAEIKKPKFNAGAYLASLRGGRRDRRYAY